MTAPAFLTLLLLVGQVPAEPPKPADAPASGQVQRPALPTDSFRPDAAWKRLGTDIWFDPKAKQVIIRSRVCQDEVPLEFFLCSKGAKDHETVLTTEAPPKMVQAALILSGAEPGHPVQFEPKFQPPAGTAIAIRAEWDRDGKKQQADARDWVKEAKSGAVLKRDWVFAGSLTYEDRRTKQAVFAADDGGLFTVANFASSILDLPYRSTDSNADLSYVANKDRIPPIGTPVTLFLAPRPKAEPGKPTP